jgi:hypothetical protein
VRGDLGRAIVGRITFGGSIIEAGTGSHCRTRSRAAQRT